MTDTAHELAAGGAAIRDHVRTIIAAARDELATRIETAASQVAALKAQADAARSNLGQHDRDGKAQSTGARQQTTAQIAAKSQTAKTTLEDALAGVQSMAAQAMETYVSCSRSPSSDSPTSFQGGTQPARSAQTGSYVFRIAGTR